MAVLISSPKDLEKFVEREGAEELFEYLEMGGILRLDTKEGRIRVVYPSRDMLKEKIKELEKKRMDVLYELNKLKKIEGGRGGVDLLLIKHRILKILDKDYRDISEKIEAEKLLRDRRGRKIIKQLQEDREYRERVREVLRESPVYKKGKFAEFVEKTFEVKGNLLGERIERLEKILNKLEREIRIVKAVIKWT